MRSRQQKRRAAVLVLIGLVALAVFGAFAGSGYFERFRYAATKDGCADVPIAPAVGPQTHPSSYLWPYGAVHACRVLDGGASLFGEPDASFTLLLETDKGAVATRMDYYNVRAGRQFVAKATEVTPDGLAGLTDDEVAAVNRAIEARGGLQSTPWVVHYGDG